MASGTIDAGQPCPTTTDMVVCGDRLGCFGGYNQTGRCVYFCDDSNPCPPGSGTCTQFNTVNGYSLKMCL